MSMFLSAISILSLPGMLAVDEYAAQRQELGRLSFIREVGVNPLAWKFSTENLKVRNVDHRVIRAQNSKGDITITWTGSTSRLTYYSNRPSDSPRSMKGGESNAGKFGEPELHRKAQRIAKEFGCDKLFLLQKGFNQFGVYSYYLCEKVDDIPSTIGKSFTVDLNARTGKVESIANRPSVVYIRGKNILNQAAAQTDLERYLKAQKKSDLTTYAGLRWTRIDKDFPDRVPHLHKVHLFNTKHRHGWTSYMVDAYNGTVSETTWK